MIQVKWRAHKLVSEISHAPGVGGQNRQLSRVFLQDSIHRSKRDPLPDYSHPKGEEEVGVQVLSWGKYRIDILY